MHRVLAIVFAFLLLTGSAYPQSSKKVLLYGKTSSPKTTFDPSHVGVASTLSNGNLTITGNGSNINSLARTVAFHAIGKYYAEFTITAGNPVANIQLGVISGSGSVSSYLGSDLNSIGFGGGGSVAINNVSVATIQTFSVNDTVSMAVDFGNKTIWFRTNGGNWNNSGAANPATNTGGISISTLTNSPFFAGANTAHTGDSITANFGSSTYVRAVPSSFGNW